MVAFRKPTVGILLLFSKFFTWIIYPLKYLGLFVIIFKAILNTSVHDSYPQPFVLIPPAWKGTPLGRSLPVLCIIGSTVPPAFDTQLSRALVKFESAEIFMSEEEFFLRLTDICVQGKS